MNDILFCSTRGTELIKKHEGLRLKAYQCPGGVWTIGYGHTRKVEENQSITKERAESLLSGDIRFSEEAVKLFVKVPVNQNEFDALVSFTFNVGSANLKKSTLLKLINKNEFLKAAGEYPKWIYSKGKILPGLVIRRNDEKELFLR